MNKQENPMVIQVRNAHVHNLSIVSGRIFKRVLFPHTGHNIHSPPISTTSLNL